MSQSKQNTARVYVKNGPTLRLSSVEGDPHAELRKVNGGAISGINASSGDRLTVRADEIVSVETPKHTPDPTILYGRRFEVRSAAAMAGDWERAVERSDDLFAFEDERVVFEETREMNREEIAVLIAEDMATAVVVIYDLGADDAVWVNTASSPEAIDLAIQAVKLLALSEAVENAFQEADAAESEATAKRNREAERMLAGSAAGRMGRE